MDHRLSALSLHAHICTHAHVAKHIYTCTCIYLMDVCLHLAVEGCREQGEEIWQRVWEVVWGQEGDVMAESQSTVLPGLPG